MKYEKDFFDDLSTKAYKRLKRMIISGDLKPGTKLVQEELAEKLGVSRTPLLQAISRLASDQLVVTKPRRGAYVRSFTIEDKLQIFDIRGKIEPLGAEEAALNIEEEELEDLRSLLKDMKTSIEDGDRKEYCELDYLFHLLIEKASKNRFISEILDRYTPIVNSEFMLKSPEISYAEHCEIFNALKTRDPERARNLMFSHVNGGSKKKLKTLLEEDKNDK
ncbi:MAG: GntR family transcriptional regulator [Sphaerochaetaceae bacterium]